MNRMKRVIPDTPSSLDLEQSPDLSPQLLAYLIEDSQIQPGAPRYPGRATTARRAAKHLGALTASPRAGSFEDPSTHIATSRPPLHLEQHAANELVGCQQLSCHAVVAQVSQDVLSHPHSP